MKKELDLDAALEEVAMKLRPQANINCSHVTRITGTRFDTVVGTPPACSCQCCSAGTRTVTHPTSGICC